METAIDVMCHVVTCTSTKQNNTDTAMATTMRRAMSTAIANIAFAMETKGTLIVSNPYHARLSTHNSKRT
eukprot:5086807-Lingulodinium_polyedra.AAC.1